MLDTIAENMPDRRPAILVCAYDADEDLSDLSSGENWTATGARLRPVDGGEPSSLAGRISGELNKTECRAVLLVGRTRRSDAFRIQMRAENRALSGGKKLSLTGPALARSTAPVAEIVRALTEAGLAAEATSEGEDDVGSYLLYRVLTALPDGADAPAVGLLRAPADLPAEDVRRGVQAAAAAMARHLSPLPRGTR